MKLKITAERTASPIGEWVENPHYTALAAALKKANGRAASHTAKASDLPHVAIDLEGRLADLGITKADRAGATAQYVSGEKLSHSYKYARTVSVIDLTRGSSGWYVTAIATQEVWPSAKTGARLILTPEQDAIAVAGLRARYTVAAPTAAL
jgi:hypothetical protein